ncbi:MAG: hypothetical protein D6791_06465 [Chloroflexi bacterium]|nr:MAG: hypothetical protein D6791_06465 [Chloroflexota bacterium]
MDDVVLAYNYDEFVDEKFERWMRFDESPPLGQPAPDFPLTDLDGRTVHLSEVWHEAAYTVVEFGSLT